VKMRYRLEDAIHAMCLRFVRIVTWPSVPVWARPGYQRPERKGFLMLGAVPVEKRTATQEAAEKLAAWTLGGIGAVFLWLGGCVIYAISMAVVIKLVLFIL
jgi:hypothetical protein